MDRLIITLINGEAESGTLNDPKSIECDAACVYTIYYNEKMSRWTVHCDFEGRCSNGQS